MREGTCQLFLCLFLLVSVKGLDVQRSCESDPLETHHNDNDEGEKRQEYEVVHMLGSKVKRELTVSSPSSSEFLPRKERPNQDQSQIRIIFGPPTVKVTRSEVEGVVGSNNVTLECFIDSFPKSTNFWMKGDSERLKPKEYVGKYNIMEDNLSHFQFRDRLRLQFLNLDVDDLGKKFRCVASNDIGTDTGGIMLSMIAPTYLETKAVPPNGFLQVSPGSRVVLQCEVKGFPLVVTYWFRDNTGEQLSWNDDYHVTEHEVGPFHYISRLHIKKVGELDFTVFKCVSKNTFGEYYHVFRIVERGKKGSQELSSKATIIGKKLDLASLLFIFFLFAHFDLTWVK